jgi:hypothetical protein
MSSNMKRVMQQLSQAVNRQLLLSASELQTRLGRKFVDETELLPLLLAHGLIRRVRTIEIEVRPLGGDSFKIALDAAKPTVGEAKTTIARSQGTAEYRQELYRVAERADGLAVREDDAEPELLEDESMVLEEGDVVAMAVKVSSVLSAVHLVCNELTYAFTARSPSFAFWFDTRRSIIRGHRYHGAHSVLIMLH